MVRKFVLTLATAATVASAAFIPTVASAGGYGYGSDVGADVRDIHRDRQELRRDYQELRRDVQTGRYGSAARDLRDIQRDRQDLRHDYQDLRHDIYRRGY
jgi:hypothetical protein